MSAAREIEERAALWLLRREEPLWSAAEEEELERWLAESDAHKAAFWRLEYGWRQADRIASLGGSTPGQRSRLASISWWKPLALAASLLLVFSLFVMRPGIPLVGQQQVQTLRFATAVGGHRVVSLPDGSQVELNTDTAIRAAMGDRRRSVWLERGEAYFEVARAQGRAFIIHAGPRVVTVLGTKFSVRRDGTALVVAVVEGQVRLDESLGESTRSVTLGGGDIAFATDRSTTVSAGLADEVRERLAWRGGLLLFDGATLADAAREFNRYNRKQIVIEGGSAARVRIGGSFEARNVDGFTRLLRNAYGLKVQDGEDKITVSG